MGASATWHPRRWLPVLAQGEDDDAANLAGSPLAAGCCRSFLFAFSASDALVSAVVDCFSPVPGGGAPATAWHRQATATWKNRAFHCSREQLTPVQKILDAGIQLASPMTRTSQPWNLPRFILLLTNPYKVVSNNPRDR